MELEKTFELETNDSGVVFGVVLKQDSRLVTLESKKLSPTQQKWLLHEQEFYAILHALKTWWHYCYGAMFKVYVGQNRFKYFYTSQTYKEDKVDRLNWCNNFIWKLFVAKGFKIM